MVLLQQIIFRLLLLGLAVGLLFLFYLAIRSRRSTWLSGRLRRIVWLTVILLPLLLAVPWTQAVLVPGNTPDWIFVLRLPDPALPYPGDRQIRLANAELDQGLHVSAAAGSSDTSDAVSPVAPVTAETIDLPALELRDWQRRIIPWFWLLNQSRRLMALYLIGAGISLAIHLYKKLKNNMQHDTQTGSKPVRDPAWLGELARVRDEIGYYRRGSLVLIDQTPDQPEVIRRCRRNNWLPLFHADVSLSDPAARRQALLLAIDRIKRPDSLFFSAYHLMRCVAWFTVPAWVPQALLLQDLQLWRCERIEKRLWRIKQPEQSNHSQFCRVRLLSGAVAALCITGLLCLGLWQNPLRLLPDMQAAYVQQQSQPQPELDIWGARQILRIHHWPMYYGSLTAPDTLLLISGQDDQANPISSIRKLDALGDTAWQLTFDKDLLQQLWQQTSVEPPDLTRPWALVMLIDNQPMNDAQHQFLLELVHGLADRRMLVTGLVNADGQLLAHHVLRNRSEDSAVMQRLMRNGDVILLDAQIVQSDHSATGRDRPQTAVRYVLERLDGQGNRIWRQDPQDPLIRRLALGLAADGAVTLLRQVGQIIPAHDNGFYLVIQEAMLLSPQQHHPLSRYDLTRLTMLDISVNDFQVYRHSDQIARISAEGHLLWVQDLGSQAQRVQIQDGLVDADGHLYLAAVVDNPLVGRSLPASGLTAADAVEHTLFGAAFFIREAYQWGAVLSLDDQGRLCWQQDLYAQHYAKATQLLLQADCLSVLISYHPYLNTSHQLADPELPCESVFQFSRDGRITAYAVLPKPSQEQENTPVFVRPGRIDLP